MGQGALNESQIQQIAHDIALGDSSQQSNALALIWEYADVSLRGKVSSSVLLSLATNYGEQGGFLACQLLRSLVRHTPLLDGKLEIDQTQMSKVFLYAPDSQLQICQPLFRSYVISLISGWLIFKAQHMDQETSSYDEMVVRAFLANLTDGIKTEISLFVSSEIVRYRGELPADTDRILDNLRLFGFEDFHVDLLTALFLHLSDDVRSAAYEIDANIRDKSSLWKVSKALEDELAYIREKAGSYDSMK